jgi:dolichol-phosphate mannosyltransferase
VLGSRYTGGVRVLNWPLKRLLLSRCAGVYVWLVTGMPLTDPTGGYKCFRRRALESLDLEAVRSNGYSFQIELTHKLWRTGFKIVEVPIIFTDRTQGQSKMAKRHRERGVLAGLAAVAAKRAAPFAASKKTLNG